MKLFAWGEYLFHSRFLIWSLEKFVDLTTTNAAKIMGLYPRKGVIAPGADADITVLNDREPRVINNDDLHESDYTPWEGQHVTAWPSMTILRGNVVVENGKFAGDPKAGQYLKRYVANSVRERSRSTSANDGHANT